jgi:hypothetical protein
MGLLAGAAAAGVGLVVIAFIVIVTWAASVGGGAGAADALRTVGSVWLLAHRVAITVDGADIALLPIGLLALPAYCLLRAGAWLAHATGITDKRGAVTGGLTVGCAYGFVAAVVASAGTTKAVHPAAGQALVAGCVVGVLFGTIGVLRGAGMLSLVAHALPDRARHVVRAALWSLVIVLGTGLALFAGGTAAHGGRVADLAGSLQPGPVGIAALVLACLAYTPNGVVWGASYAVGPGFAVGAHTSVAPFGVHLGAVPAFPLLAALPSDGAPAYALPALVLPLVAGAVGGVLVTRRVSAARIRDAALWGLLTGVTAGLMLAVLAALSGGPAGPGRLATVGPSAWQVGLAAVLELGVTAALAAAETQRRAHRR